jgi:hypothetical protein
MVGIFLAWFDASKTKSPPTKIAEAVERYRQKFKQEPTVCLVNPADACATTLVEVRPSKTIGRGCFWVGRDDDA